MPALQIAAESSRRAMFLAMLALAALLAVALGRGGETPIAVPASDDAPAEPKTGYGKLPLSFVPNAGQTDPSVRYYAQAGSRSFFFTPDKAVLSFAGKERGMALDLRFLGAAPNAALVAERQQKGTVSYLNGERHHSGLRTYGQVTYRDLWPGIDMTFRGSGGALKYEFLVHPGARVSDIGLAYAGASGLALTEAGALRIQTPLGPLTDTTPRSYQRTGGRNVPVGSRFQLDRAAGKNAYGFSAGRHDRGRPLVIDPGLVYSTYLGSSGPDGGNEEVDIAVDDAGSAYVTGQAGSTNFPTTPGAYDTDGGGTFVTKLDPSGSSLVYSTYLAPGFVKGIAIDGDGNAYVTGSGGSPEVPTTTIGPVGGYDIYVIKLNATGSARVYSTLLGGSEMENEPDIAVDGAGRAYVSGTTYSANFPTTLGAYDRTFNSPAGHPDAFIAKLNPSGSALDYSTLVGGSYGDVARAIAVDSSGSAYITGYTSSTNYPTTAGAYDETFNGESPNAFVTKLNPTGSALSYSTLAGSGAFGSGIAVDAAGSAYVTGSGAIPTTPGAYVSPASGSSDIFVLKLNPTGSAPAYSLELSGSNNDSDSDIAVDAEGLAYVVGRTASSDFPATAGAADVTHNGNFDLFVTKLNASGSNVLYSTYLGGANLEGWDQDIAIDGQGNAYAAGITWSTDFPTTRGAFDRTYNGGSSDVSVTKLDFLPPYPMPSEAVSVYAAIVPTFKQCGTGGNPVNAAHAPPLGVGSRGPPRPGGFARIGAQSTMYAILTAEPGDNNGTNGDQANVSIFVSMTDITTSTGSDYTPNPSGPDMTLYTRLRFTDRDNGPSAQESGTAGDFDFALPLECTATPSTSTGSGCSALTSVEAVTPGLIKEGKATVIQTFRIRVNDSGLDGIRGSADDAVFATQGLFVP